MHANANPFTETLTTSLQSINIHTTFLCFLSRRSFSICWRAGLVVLHSLRFCLSVKLLNSPSYLTEILDGYSNLGCRLFSFITLNMSYHSLLAWTVSIERSAVILMGIPLCVICCFSLATFNICSLCLIFVNLINMCLGVFCLVVILFGFLGLVWLFPSPFGGSFQLLSPRVFSHGLCVNVWQKPPHYCKVISLQLIKINEKINK